MRTIDADALKEAFEMDGYKSPYVARLIDACPTVETVKHGFWMLQDDTYTRRMCSVCESANHEGWESYCPNCGAKMDARMG